MVDDHLTRREEDRGGPRGVDYLNRSRRDAIEREYQEAGPVMSAWTAGLGVIGLGAAILGAPLAKGNLVANLLHFLGHGRQIRIPVRRATLTSGANSRDAGLRSFQDAFWNVKRNQLQLQPLDIVDDIQAADHLLSSVTHTQSREFLRERIVEHFHRRNVSSGVHSGFFSHGLQRITIGEVLSESGQNYWRKAVGSHQFGAIRDALQKGIDTGYLHKNHILDKNLFVTREGFLRDLRVGRTLGSRLDMFGQGVVAQSLLGARTQIARLAPNSTHQGTRFFVGGTVYGIEESPLGPATVRTLQTNRKLRLSGDPLSVITAAREGRLQAVGRSEARGLLGTQARFAGLQTKLGIGATFATRPSHLERYIINPVRRLRGLATGRAQLYRVGHKYAGESVAGRTTEAVAGGHLPEAFTNLGRPIVAVPDGRQVADYSGIGWIDRLKVALDIHPDYRVVSQGAVGKLISDPAAVLSNKHLFVPLPTGGIKTTGLGISPGGAAGGLKPPSLTAVGDVVPGYRAAYYDVDKGFARGLADFLNYSFYRVVNLSSESLLGVGFLPGRTFLGSAARLGAIPVGYEAARQAFSYLDYEIENLTGLSPVKAAADLYTTGRVGLQQVRSTLGIQQGLDWLEENFPGSVDSPLAFIGRHGLVAGAFFGLAGRSFKAAGIAAGALGAAIGGVEPGQDPEELRAEYSGDRKVPVRQGAFWGLGFSPWTGGQILRYDYSWYHKLQSNYRTNSIYGSPEEYWSYHANVFGLPFPTPRNVLGLSNILNPYRLEELHGANRPYPVTGGFMEEFPIIGPAIAATIGQVIKPPRTMSMGPTPLLKAGLVDRGLSPSAAEDLGLPSLVASEVELGYPDDPLARLQRQIAVASEPMGVYKFAMQYLGAELGIEEPDAQTASSLAIGSAGREFYGMGLGGALGQTEFLRRFMLSDYSLPNKMREQYNPIPNTMPDWLPGRRSSDPRDQGYFIDYTIGDPYVKIEQGEARLPGRGYEALNELHSGIPGQYDIVDRFLILADVAPYSAAYRKYADLVQSMNLSPEWRARVDTALEQRDRVVNYRSDYPRYYDKMVDLNEAIKARGLYSSVRQGYDVLTHDFLAEIPFVGSKLAPFRNEAEQYRREVTEGAYFASWFTPYESIVRPGVTNIAYSNPVMGAVKGAVVGALAISPAGRFLNPFAPSMAGSGPGSIVGGGALVGAGLSLGRMTYADQTDIPGYRQEQIDQMVYLDRLSYIRARVWQSEAESQGNQGLASQFQSQAQRTMLGAFNEVTARSALPTSSDRRFFNAFASTPEQNRAQLLRGLPAYYQQTLRSVWGDSDFLGQEEADARALEYVQYHGIPDTDFIGWHPSIPTNAVRVKLGLDSIGGDSDYLHRYGFHESQYSELKHRLPDLYAQQVNYVKPTEFGSFESFLKSQREKLRAQFGNSSLFTQTHTTPNRMRSYYTVNVDRRPEVLNYLQDVI